MPLPTFPSWDLSSLTPVERDTARTVEAFLAWMAKTETDLARWQAALMFQVALRVVTCDDLSRFNRFAVSLYGYELMLLDRLRTAGIPVPTEPPFPPLFSTGPLAYDADTRNFTTASLDCDSTGRPDFAKLTVRRMPPPCPPLTPLSGELGAPPLAALCMPPNYAGLFACLVFASIGVGFVSRIGRMLTGADKALIDKTIRDRVAEDMAKRTEAVNRCIAEQWAVVPPAQRTDERMRRIGDWCDKKIPVPPSAPPPEPGLATRILSASWKIALAAGIVYGTWFAISRVRRMERDVPQPPPLPPRALRRPSRRLTRIPRRAVVQ